MPANILACSNDTLALLLTMAEPVPAPNVACKIPSNVLPNSSSLLLSILTIPLPILSSDTRVIWLSTRLILVKP
ncbi:hypothetical protein DJ56_4183 [Yersinia pestis]|nr:hypothetical protein DJ56_4183 [Yersinia pestis]